MLIQCLYKQLLFKRCLRIVLYQIKFSAKAKQELNLLDFTLIQNQLLLKLFTAPIVFIRKERNHGTSNRNEHT